MLQATMRGVDLYGNLRGVDLYGHMAGVDLYGQRATMGPRGLGGLGATGNADVKDLQNALKAWAAAGHPTADPGDVDGIVGPKTRAAVVAVISQLPKIPEDVRTAILAAGAAAAFSDSATGALDNAITSYAKQIAAAIRAVMIIDPQQQAATIPPVLRQVHVLTAGNAPAPSSATAKLSSWFSIPEGKTWYQTGWGKGAIGIGAVALGVTAVKLVL